MKVPISWLKEYIDITMPLEDLAERMTLAGLEVGAIERIGDWWDREKIVVGEVREVRSHPNADRLVLTDVDWGGDEIEQCVTGAPNLFPYKGVGPVSFKVAFAMEGAELYDGYKEGFVKTRLKRARIRGVPSRAMVCSEKELGISDEHEGIMILPDDAPVGAPLACVPAARAAWTRPARQRSCCAPVLSPRWPSCSPVRSASTARPRSRASVST